MDSFDEVVPEVKSQIGNDFDFGNIDLPVANPIQPLGNSVMDFSDFENGIEEITSDSEEYVKGLIYGKNKTGKTTFSGTFPGPILILDINEKGTKPLVNQGHKKRFIETFDMFMMSYWFLKNGNHEFKTVVLDNVTNLQEIVMKFIMRKNQDTDPYKDMDLPKIQDWGGLSLLMKRWLIDFRNLDMNILFIAQEKKSNEDGDMESEEHTVFPQVSASVRGILGASVDFIINTFIKETIKDNKKRINFCGRIGPSSRYLTGIRVPPEVTAPGVLKNPKFSSIIKIMNGEI